MPPKKKSPKKSSGPPGESSGTLSPQHEHIAGDRKDSDQDGPGSESSFGSVPEETAHTFVDSVENLYENLHGTLPEGQPHISVEVRRAFVEMFPKLQAANYNGDACTAILDLLILGVDNESLKQELPMLAKIPPPTDSSRISAAEMVRVQSKLDAIRQTPIPTVEEVKQKLGNQVSDNGQSARQGFGSGLHAGLMLLLKNVPGSVGLTPENLPTIDKMHSFTGTGIMSLLMGVNILGSATMAFMSPISSSGGGSHTSPVDGSKPAALDDSSEDQTGFETLVASLHGGTSKNASLSKLHSLTGGINRSLFFT